MRVKNEKRRPGRRTLDAAQGAVAFGRINMAAHYSAFFLLCLSAPNPEAEAINAEKSVRHLPTGRGEDEGFRLRKDFFDKLIL
jgi:hypothetical protein